MEGASSLFPVEIISIKNCRFNCSVSSKQAPKIPSGDAGETHDLARIFLRLRLRRRTRFFLHLALIFVLLMVARLVTGSPGPRTFLERRRRLTILRG